VKEVAGPNYYTRLILTVNGEFQRQVWSYSSNQWVIEWSVPDLCSVYSVCGAFGICDMTSSNQYCQCLPGFEPASQLDWNLNSWSGGCARRTNLRCGITNSSMKGSQDEFSVVSNVMLPDDGHELKQVESQEECKIACSDNCSCSAYAYQSNQCYIWYGEIRNLKLASSDYSEVIELYLRISGSDIPGKKTRKKMFKVAQLILVSGVALIIIIIFSYFIYRRRSYHKMAQTNGLISQFSYFFLEHCTNKFSQKVGEGSFGPVFKGQLPNSTKIAVKRLGRLRQGEKQFKTEVKTLGSIQHVNLVQLCGFCLKGEERLIVYHYMQNRSLDTHLFDEASETLDWKLRFQIIVGVARGLAYLHEQCRVRIIHCDVKPGNILLDDNFSPKISDFGMAKLLGREFEDVLTTTRGTIGYLAPEWILGLPITSKVDVYSYGMMLFEIISGKRNNEQRGVGYFPVQATINVREGEVESLLDERLKGEVVLEELTRVARLACWCIQDHESHRPTMTQAVHILEGSRPVGVAPVPTSLQEVASDCLSV
jgi:Protein kinase domain/S-locus glycoprotein domain/PAN-like domain